MSTLACKEEETVIISLVIVCKYNNLREMFLKHSLAAFKVPIPGNSKLNSGARRQFEHHSPAEIENVKYESDLILHSLFFHQKKAHKENFV